MDNQTLTLNVHRLISGLVAQGVRYFVVSPGSRSTPIALLLAERVKKSTTLQLYVDVDERSAAFFALGIAKTQQVPVVLLCTSGTAAAEYLPAIAEANLSHVPLVLLTTDRPLELTDIGAPQAIEQTDLYGKQVKKAWRLALQTPGPTNAAFVSFQSQRSVVVALTTPQGPVHLNLPLRKPLLPDLNVAPPQLKSLRVAPAKRKLTTAELSRLKQELSGKRVLIIAGPEETQTYRTVLLTLSQQCHWPILADNLANLRGTNTVIAHYDLLLRLFPNLPTTLQPDVILRVGGTPVSARLVRWLAKQTLPVYLIGAQRQLADYSYATTEVIAADEATVLTQLAANLPQQASGYLVRWQQYERRLVASLPPVVELNEMTLIQQLDRSLPANSYLFISNSMPIRDVDDFYSGRQMRELVCNRGANGIDGVVSTAAGMATSPGQHYLLIGDLALFHDMNGLMIVRRYQLPLKIIVINNNGGGIFSFLPQAQAKAHFELLFGTPQNLDLKQVAALYQLSYQRVKTLAEFKQALADQVQFIEVLSNRRTNVEQHQALLRRLRSALQDD